MSSTKEASALAKKYQKKTDKEHILDNPDTYTGSMEQIANELHVLNTDEERVSSREINYIPGLINCLMKPLSTVMITLFALLRRKK